MMGMSKSDKLAMYGTAAVGLTIAVTSGFAKVNGLTPTPKTESTDNEMKLSLPSMPTSVSECCTTVAQLYTDYKGTMKSIASRLGERLATGYFGPIVFSYLYAYYLQRQALSCASAAPPPTPPPSW